MNIHHFGLKHAFQTFAEKSKKVVVKIYSSY
jgi:hypothetical protein